MATIMVIEDNLIYRELLRELCESEGHEVVETGRAEDALLMLKNYGGNDVFNQERGIDLFIVDFNMDRMNGFELIRELRSMEKMNTAPILMISSTAKNMGDLLKTEGVSFLPKPSPNVLVMATVRNLLEKAAKSRPAAAPAAPIERRAPARPPMTSIMAASTQAAPAPLKPLPPRVPHQAPPPQVRDPFRRAQLPPMPIKALKSSPPAAIPPAAVPPALPPAHQLPMNPSHNALPPAAPSHPAQPPIVPPPHCVPQAESRPALGSIDDGIRNDISQSTELTEFLMSRQKISDSEEVIDAANSPVADLLEKILDSAIRQRASDIHIEPQAAALDVRLRVDGVLRPLLRLPTAVADNVIARIKIMSSLNITERRLPQDGQFIRNGAEGRTTKFRVSTLPSMHGEKVVLRVLPSGSLQVHLDGIGFSSHDLELIRKVLRAPNGLILLTGPTGSGKTTSLYTMLESLNNGKRNIITVEDPVEYQLKGITQVQVNPAIGYTFDRVLRSFLRQDPDVMLVGEIRDLETAEIALKAAATGHLVFTTLHTNNAASAVQRLLSMGLPSYLVAAATRLVIAQRLVRALCPTCKAPGTLSEDEACMLRPEEIAGLQKVWRPVGCAACQGIGYKGRRVVMEALPILTTKTRMAITKGASPDEIEALAVEDGMSPMRRQALALVADGTISAEEALSVLHV